MMIRQNVKMKDLYNNAYNGKQVQINKFFLQFSDSLTV